MGKLIISARPNGTVRHGPGTRCGSNRDLTVDHDVPLAKGGTNDRENLRTMCAACNWWKGDRLV